MGQIRVKLVVVECCRPLFISVVSRRAAPQVVKYKVARQATEKNIGVQVHEIRERFVALCGDVRYWIENSTYPPDEIAVRFHHKLTFVHPFPNGNGRHARLIADVLLIKLGRPAFTWGSANLVKEGEARKNYLEVIRAADNGDIQPLLKFARS